MRGDFCLLTYCEFFNQGRGGTCPGDHRSSALAHVCWGFCYWFYSCLRQHHNSTTSCCRAITSLYIWILFWKVQVLCCHVFCACHSTFEGENLRMHHHWNYHCNHSTVIVATLHFRPDKFFQFLLGKSKIQLKCVHFQLFELFYVTEFGEKVVVHFQYSLFCILKNEEADNDWLFVFNLCFGSSTSYSEIFTWCSFLNNTIISWMCFLVAEVLRYSVSAAVHNPARSFIVSATILEFRFSSPFSPASTADCTKLLKHFFRVYAPKRTKWMTTCCSSNKIQYIQWLKNTKFEKKMSWFTFLMTVGSISRSITKMSSK